MQNISNMTIREIAVAEPATTRVFEEFKIDYCCGGGKSFADACSAAGVAPQVVTEKIDAVLGRSIEMSDAPEQKSASELIQYIIDKHHVFTRTELTRLSALVEKVAGKHGDNHPELRDIRDAFSILANDLVTHMAKEEMVLFPYIERLDIAARKSLPVPFAPFGSVNNPIRMMCTEHEEAGNILRKMRELSSDYTVPADACPSFRALYFGLNEIELDLHQHIHLENNVLFHRAVELEKTALSMN